MLFLKLERIDMFKLFSCISERRDTTPTCVSKRSFNGPIHSLDMRETLRQDSHILTPLGL